MINDVYIWNLYAKTQGQQIHPVSLWLLGGNQSYFDCCC